MGFRGISINLVISCKTVIASISCISMNCNDFKGFQDFKGVQAISSNFKGFQGIYGTSRHFKVIHGISWYFTELQGI